MNYLIKTDTYKCESNHNLVLNVSKYAANMEYFYQLPNFNKKNCLQAIHHLSEQRFSKNHSIFIKKCSRFDIP